MLKRIAVLFLVVLMGCTKWEPTITTTPEPEVVEDNIYILYTSDIHCGVGDNLGLPKLKAMLTDLKQEHPYVSLVDLGDNIQGGAIGALSKGEYVISLLNEVGYDFATIGNHEFDYGMPRLKELMNMANYGYIASNVRYSGTKENIFADIPTYRIKEFGNTKVGFIGVLTPEAIISSTPTFFQEDGEYVYDFYGANNGEELYQRVQEIVDEVRAQEVDYVVVMAHLGSVAENAPYDSISLISHTTGIDVVLDGHSHSTIVGDPYPNKNGDDVILTSVGTKLENVGELIITPEGEIQTALLSEYDKEDETMKQKIAEINEQLNTLLETKEGELTFDLTITDENGKRISRTRETNLGDIVADSIRDYLKCDVAIINGGGLRKAISAGKVTYGNLFDVLPFGNTIGATECTGQQILDLLEFSSKDTQGITVFEDNPVGEFGGFLQVSGLKYTINTSIPTPVKLDDQNFFMGIEGERRVSDVQIEQPDGSYVPIDPEGTYTVGSSTYILFDGGDGNTVLSKNEPTIDNGDIDLDVFKKYFESIEDFSIYEKPQGRITVK